MTEFQRSDTPGYDFIMRDREMRWNDLRAADAVKRSPKGQRGDRLWVQESYRIEGAGTSGNRCRYLADDTTRLTEDLWDADSMEKWSKRQFPFRPSPGRFMYRCLSRIDLEITGVRVQRLQDISEEDILAEGVTVDRVAEWCGVAWSSMPTLHDAWRVLWDSINGERPGCSWADSPWVWAISFARIRP